MVPYPHRVKIMRRPEFDGAVEDDWGRTVPAPAVSMGTASAWVQHLSAEEATDLAERGPVEVDHLIFLYPVAGVAVSEADYLETLDGGGQPAGRTFQIASIEDPDGTGHHLEIYGIERKSLADVPAAEAVSS